MKSDILEVKVTVRGEDIMTSCGPSQDLVRILSLVSPLIVTRSMLSSVCIGGRSYIGGCAKEDENVEVDVGFVTLLHLLAAPCQPSEIVLVVAGIGDVLECLKPLKVVDAPKENYKLL